MQITLLMVAAVIALVGAAFHGYVGGRLVYAKYQREPVSASDAVTQFSVLAYVHRLFIGERHYVYGGGAAASLGVNGRAVDVGECVRRVIIFSTELNGACCPH